MTMSRIRRKLKDSAATHFPLVYGVFNSIRKKSLKLTFSQCGEDLAFAKYLPETHGMYLDIGGGHPVIGSNTYSLERRGYAGYVVEPIPRFSKNFWKRNHVIEVFETICSSKNSLVEFIEFENAFLSTTSADRASNLIEMGEKVVSRKNVLSVTLSDLKITTTPKYASLLDIDVEGVDLDVLKSNNWTSFRPRVILVESHLENKNLIIDYLESLNYQVAKICKMTLVFVATEYLRA